MTVLAILVLVARLAGQNPVSERVAHPHSPCWTGERTSTSAGERRSEMVVFDTRDGEQPYLITHNRDQIWNGANPEQDYNFIDYWFGDPGSPIRARHYFGSDEGVSVFLPVAPDAELSLAQARERMPAGVLCYLQRRFERIGVLVADGYQTLWASRR